MAIHYPAILPLISLLPICQAQSRAKLLARQMTVSLLSCSYTVYITTSLIPLSRTEGLTRRVCQRYLSRVTAVPALLGKLDLLQCILLCLERGQRWAWGLCSACHLRCTMPLFKLIQTFPKCPSARAAACVLLEEAALACSCHACAE